MEDKRVIDNGAKSNALLDEAVERLGLTPTEQQLEVMRVISDFATRQRGWEAILVNGYAGTGKTSVLGAMVSAMKHYGIKSVTLAPTGRAAKVAEGFSGGKASTIHKELYRQNPSSTGKEFFLARNQRTNTIFFVDEASMITDEPTGRSVLLDLISYVYSSPGCAIVFIGDNAQLPPVGQDQSPAMNPQRLAELNLKTTCLNMDTTVRNASSSGILYNATLVRNILASGSNKIPQLAVKGFADVHIVDAYDLEDSLSTSYSRVGTHDTIVITRSNKRARNFNLGIRNRILGIEEPLQRNELLVVTRNNYFWKKDKQNSLIANGEQIYIDWLGKPEKKYGRWFVDADVYMGDSEDLTGVKIMLKSLASESSSLPASDVAEFRKRIMDGIEGEITQKLKGVDEDPYANALEVKYAYCVTCHKAQGGQWKHVYVDMGGISEESMGSTFYRWLYTAITRATEQLFLIAPKGIED